MSKKNPDPAPSAAGPLREQLRAAGVPESEIPHAEALFGGLSFGTLAALLALASKYKQYLPILWELFKDLQTALGSGTPAPPAPTEGDPFGHG